MPADELNTRERAMSAESSRPADIVYYRRDGIVVTSQYFTAYNTRYHVRDLSLLTRSESSPHPGVRLGILAAVAGAIVAIPTLLMLHSLAGLAISVPVLLIPCLTSYVCAHRWPVEIELLARYRGRQIVLIATSDQRKFGQIARALMRAVEALELSQIKHR